jgi:hypothetical protein
MIQLYYTNKGYTNEIKQNKKNEWGGVLRDSILILATVPTGHFGRAAITYGVAGEVDDLALVSTLTPSLFFHQLFFLDGSAVAGELGVAACSPAGAPVEVEVVAPVAPLSFGAAA